MKFFLTFLSAAFISTNVFGYQLTDTVSNDASEPATTQLLETEKLRATIQDICPVTGKKLGSMGVPIKVTAAGDQQLFLCCKGCQGKEVKPEYWKIIKTNLATAQKTCPIMGKPVDAEMESTIVDGQMVFVCCPPCIEKIRADTETAMKKVFANYETHVSEQRRATTDRLQIAAQRICPVSGELLGSMGEPMKVKVGPEEIAFLCCKACVGKKIEAKLWREVQTNLALAQKECPITGEPVTSESNSLVISGRKIFTCCPDCLEKIKVNPVESITKVNSLIESHVPQPKTTDLEATTGETSNR